MVVWQSSIGFSDAIWRECAAFPGYPMLQLPPKQQFIIVRIDRYIHPGIKRIRFTDDR